jgi:hypothetical protein
VPQKDLAGPVIELALSKRHNKVGVYLAHLKTEIDPVFEMFCLLVT